MEVSQKIWNEGREAFSQGFSEADCPYDMQTQWGDWADWVCGHGEAMHEKITAPQPGVLNKIGKQLA
ncbi:hypothetical protein [Rhizobium leguminosarum]